MIKTWSFGMPKVPCLELGKIYGVVSFFVDGNKVQFFVWRCEDPTCTFEFLWNLFRCRLFFLLFVLKMKEMLFLARSYLHNFHLYTLRKMQIKQAAKKTTSSWISWGLLLPQEIGGHVRSAEHHIESEILCAQPARYLQLPWWKWLGMPWEW